MNELIAQLARDAGLISAFNSAPNRPDIEKFAELIVRECMNLVKDCYAEPQSGQSPHRTACASTIIEEHFGVEE